MDCQRLLEWRRSSDARIIYLALGFFLIFGFNNVSYLLPVFYTQIGYTVQDSGWLVSIFYVFSVSIRPFVGHLLIALGFRRAFAIAGVLSFGGAVGIALTGLNFWAAFTARAVFGIGAGLAQVTLATYQGYAFDGKERGRAYSLIMAGGLAPMMTVVPMGDWLLHHGYGYMYIFLPALLSIVSLFVTLTLPTLAGGDKPSGGPARKSLNPFRGFGECAAIPAFRITLLALFLFCMVDALSAFMSPMANSYGLMASYFLSANAVMGVSVRLFFGRLLDRFPRWMVSAPLIIGMAVSLLLASVNPTWWTLALLGMCFGVGMGFGFPLHLALIPDNAPQRLLPQAMSMSWFMLGSGFAIVPLATAWLGGLTDQVFAYRVVALCVLAGGLALAWLWRRNYKKA